jgi:ubiquinone/menaquinone biosynthesis C-methylase UbiE
VLEVGFGTGHCLVALAQAVGPTGKVYGIDSADAMRQRAEDNLQKAGLTACLRRDVARRVLDHWGRLARVTDRHL